MKTLVSLDIEHMCIAFMKSAWLTRSRKSDQCPLEIEKSTYAKKSITIYFGKKHSKYKLWKGYGIQTVLGPNIEEQEHCVEKNKY